MCSFKGVFPLISAISQQFGFYDDVLLVLFQLTIKGKVILFNVLVFVRVCNVLVAFMCLPCDFLEVFISGTGLGFRSMNAIVLLKPE